jgi:ethylbenzene dioxygenase alpha subunit
MTFSPTGVFEMDDGENWEHVTGSNRGVVARRLPMYYGLGSKSAIEHPELPGTVHHDFFNDANQRAFYTRWAELLSTP